MCKTQDTATFAFDVQHCSEDIMPYTMSTYKNSNGVRRCML